MDDQQKDLAREKASLVQDYLTVFESDEGKKVLLDLMDKGYILKPTASVGGERDANLNEGKRELVLYIMDMVTYDVKDIMDLIGNNETTKKGGSKDEKEEQLFDFFKD